MDGQPSSPSNLILVGKVTGVHGVRGMLKVLPHADHPQELLRYTTWWFKHLRETKAFQLEKGQIYQEKGLLLKFQGIDSPESGKYWVGAELLLDRAELLHLDKGHYWADLEGLAVYTVENVYLGHVSHLFETGANDVLVVKEGTQELLIPYVPEHVVKEVDLAAGKIVVDYEV